MPAIWVAIAVTVADQLTKQWVRDAFALGESRPVIEGLFNLTYVRNTGAAWGMFGGHGWALILISVGMLTVMILWRRQFVSDAWEHRLAYGLLIGGILGNLFDRIRLAAVTDFLDFYVGEYHWPAFNIADSAICTGVFLYIASSFWLHAHPLNHPENEAQEAGPPGPSSP